MSMISLGVPAAAGDCPGHPDAIGTSRVLVVDPTEHARIGTMQYRETLPLEDHEVVLTFDDGPLPPYTNRVLETLNANCVKATYFLIGKQAQAFPDMVRQIHAAGHTIGTHSQNHPLRFEHMALPKVEAEVDQGIASVTAALGDPSEVAPFFRIPGLLRATTVEDFLASRSIMTWSADFPADDWRHISAAEVIHRALTRLEAKGKGVLLLHDMQPATALALPRLLAELKKRGYRIVQVVPATATQPKTPTTADQWLMKSAHNPTTGSLAVHVAPAPAVTTAPAATPAPAVTAPRTKDVETTGSITTQAQPKSQIR
ncbi:MAG TPA: polysaccharide deacetylase family protein [Xanthobacteraceae bacterium]|nr:polysaccharide deacetylase family protein [Xanthobacteraceae bacterium]